MNDIPVKIFLFNPGLPYKTGRPDKCGDYFVYWRQLIGNGSHVSYLIGSKVDINVTMDTYFGGVILDWKYPEPEHSMIIKQLEIGALPICNGQQISGYICLDCNKWIFDDESYRNNKNV